MHGAKRKNEKKDIGHAITQLIEEYNRANTLDWVRDPVGYALYQTWYSREQKKSAAERENYAKENKVL